MYDVIVIGAGPAGIMTSIIASSRLKKVLLIDKNDAIGKKLAITGGGRCNLTNLKNTNDFIKYIPNNNKFLYSTLSNFNSTDIYNYFNTLGVKLKMEDDNRIFPMDNKSMTIINALNNELIKNKVEIMFNETVIDIKTFNQDYIVITNNKEYKTKKIVIATGGASYPHTGSSGDGYKFAKLLNQPLNKLYPAETFLINEHKLPLAGITIPYTKVSINNITMEGSLLFTHEGLSGPAIFKISEYVYKELEKSNNATISIDLIPNINMNELINKLKNYDSKKMIKYFVGQFTPHRLANYLLEINNINPDKKILESSKEEQHNLFYNMKNYHIDIKSTGTIAQSFITGGGIDLKYINPKTMESTINKGIYFIGELLDIHGHTGGYNITIALSTGYTAGLNI